MTDLGISPTFTTLTGRPQEAIGVFGVTRTDEDEAVREGRAFIASTAVTSIPLGRILVFVFRNPANSGVNVMLTSRRFSSDQSTGDTPIEYLAYVNPTYVPAAASVVASRVVGGPSSVCTFRYTVGTAASITMGGIAASGETIMSGGGATTRDVLVVVPPGTSLGYTVTGAGNNLIQAIRASGTLEWYEEPV